MTNEARRTLKAQLAQRAQLYRLLVLSLPSYDDVWKQPWQTWGELDYARQFLNEFRHELHLRAMHAEIVSKAIRVEENEG